MTVHASRMASANADACAGSCRLRCEKLRVTAVLDTIPPRMPVSANPCSLPSAFTST